MTKIRASGWVWPSRPPACARLGPNSPPTFSFALTGDSIITRRLSVYSEPAFTRVIDLVRGADAAFTNLEMLFHDYEPYAMNESGGTYMRAEPALVEGARLGRVRPGVARQQSHRRLRRARHEPDQQVRRGGRDWCRPASARACAEAREAKFLETPKGRVALISVASTFTDHSRAGSTRGDMPARPGLNPLRFTTITTVTPERMATLREMANEINGRPREAARPPAIGETFTFFGRRFIAGATPGVRTEPNAGGLEEIAAVVQERVRPRRLHDRHDPLARGWARSARCRRISSSPSRTRWSTPAPTSSSGTARTSCAASRSTRASPILYSLGDFIFQNETLLRLPSDNYDTYDLGAVGARQRLQRRALRPRQGGLSRRSPHLGSGGGRAVASAATSSSSWRCIRSRSASARRGASAGARSSPTASSARRSSATS